MTDKAAALAASAQPARERLVVEPAGVRRRLASLLYESLLLLGILAVGFLVPNLILGMAFGVSSPGWFLWVHVYVVLGAYFVWYWMRNGQTLAMQTWRLKLVRSDGQPLSWQRALLRYSLAWPSLLCFGVGLLWVVFDRERQFLHDRLADTCIVLMPPEKGARR